MSKKQYTVWVTYRDGTRGMVPLSLSRKRAMQVAKEALGARVRSSPMIVEAEVVAERWTRTECDVTASYTSLYALGMGEARR